VATLPLPPIGSELEHLTSGVEEIRNEGKIDFKECLWTMEDNE